MLILQCVSRIYFNMVRWSFKNPFWLLFALSVNLWGRWGNNKNWLELKIEPPSACQNQWNASRMQFRCSLCLKCNLFYQNLWSSPTASLTNLDQGSRTLYSSQFWPFLKRALFFWGSLVSCWIWVKLKIEPPQANLACQNWWNTL